MAGAAGWAALASMPAIGAEPKERPSGVAGARKPSNASTRRAARARTPGAGPSGTRARKRPSRRSTSGGPATGGVAAAKRPSAATRPSLRCAKPFVRRSVVRNFASDYSSRDNVTAKTSITRSHGERRRNSSSLISFA